MAAEGSCSLDYFPENILMDILSYLTVRELVRAGRVCKRWKRLVQDHRLWRHVDLTEWKALTSRVLWVLLRRYLGGGLRELRLQGLLLSVRPGALLSRAWLGALAKRCPQLSRLSLRHVDLREVGGCQFLPCSLRTLELMACEIPRAFFHSVGGSSGIQLETLIVDSVPSFCDEHLRALGSLEGLMALEVRESIRVTEAGLRAAGLGRLVRLELVATGRVQGGTAGGLAEGLPGLRELTLGGAEVEPGLPCVPRLVGLRCLRLRDCALSPGLLLPPCQAVPSLRSLQLSHITLPRGTEDQDAIRQGLPSCVVTFSHCSPLYHIRPVCIT
ncbi:F-box/LRR-repeat protein 12 [Amia ocellicauda]|uniref:F-box/LRR-repeat protein 12 n=1 Tax=Amia ocellicauda TaxID=2972642 RepID=UPI003464B977